MEKARLGDEVCAFRSKNAELASSVELFEGVCNGGRKWRKRGDL